MGIVYAIEYTWVSMAQTVPVREFRIRLSRLLSDVSERRDHVIVTRNGKPAAVLVPIDEYEALEETVDVVCDAATVRAIESGLAELGRDEAVSLTGLA
jgi:prevent-host-death family protein